MIVLINEPAQLPVYQVDLDLKKAVSSAPINTTSSFTNTNTVRHLVDTHPEHNSLLQ